MVSLGNIFFSSRCDGPEMDICVKDKDAEKMPESILVVLLMHYIYCLWQSLQNTNAKAMKRVSTYLHENQCKFSKQWVFPFFTGFLDGLVYCYVFLNNKIIINIYLMYG